MKLILREPTIRDEKEILDMCKEFDKQSDNTGNIYEGITNFRNISNFKEWLNKIEESKNIEQIKQHLVNQTTYILVDENNRVYGACNIRHRLNDKLIQHGGNIGHAIRPSERGCGYANELMKLEFEKCIELGIERPLVTARIDNIPSNKTIVKNGGELENQFQDLDTGLIYNRYWCDALIYVKDPNKK